MEFDKELFEKVEKKEQKEEIVRESLTYWQDFWRRFRKNKPALIALVFIILLVLGCIFIPMFSDYTYDQIIKTDKSLPPSFEHLFGTDTLGHDLFIRVVYGARISLSIGIVASLINLTIGVIYGGISGYFGGKVDMVMMRIIEMIDSVPLVLYVIVLQVTFQDQLEEAFETIPFLQPLNAIGSDLVLIYLVFGLIYWIGMARIVRGQVLTLKNREYVLAAKSQGAGPMRIILKHLVPNAMGQIIVMVTLAIPTAIFTEAFLSFIGLGVNAPMPSWGSLANEGAKSLQVYPHMLFFPAAAICLTVLAFNILGDALRDSLDPKLRK